jgi:hypothetical protein
MAGFGVAAKQTDRARQAFERSADQAGFFAHGTDRLILPSGISARPETVAVDVPSVPTPQEPGGGNGGGPPLHPFIRGLLETLPPPHSDWSIADRVKWLETAASIFGLIYKGAGSVRVEVQDG